MDEGKEGRSEREIQGPGKGRQVGRGRRWVNVMDLGAFVPLLNTHGTTDVLTLNILLIYSCFYIFARIQGFDSIMRLII